MGFLSSLPPEIFVPLKYLIGILGISFLVIVHETGHYLMARAFGMRVLRYSLGFGPVIFKHQPKGSPTIFQVCALPVLAYVQIDGMNPAEENDPSDPALFSNKSVFARFCAIFGGPLANYLFAAICLFFLFSIDGIEEPQAGPQIVSGVVADTPAAEADVQPGDAITEIDGHEITSYEQLVTQTRAHEGQATEYVVLRDGERVALTLTPRLHEGNVVIGVQITMPTTYRDASVGEAAFLAVVLPGRISIATVAAIGNMIRERTLAGLSGPAGMATQASRSVEEGPRAFLQFLIYISIALGFFNLLPLPALDGGRLVFLGFELVTRRRANERVEAMIHTVGLLFLLGLIAVVTVVNDLSSS